MGEAREMLVFDTIRCREKCYDYDRIMNIEQYSSDIGAHM